MTANDTNNEIFAINPNGLAVWPTADAVFGATRPAGMVAALKLFRSVARARLLDGSVVRPDLKTAVAAVRSFDGGFGSFSLAVEHGAYLPAMNIRG